MSCKETERKTLKKMSANEKYLHQLFCLLKKGENIAVVGKNSTFNDTELRLLGAILDAKFHGERLISTRLADILGVTRSAVSQIVNRLEMRGIVRRVDDEVDRKIAYIEVSDDVIERYEKEIKLCAAFTGKVVKKYGVEKFQTLCEMADDFFELLEVEKQNFSMTETKK